MAKKSEKKKIKTSIVTIDLATFIPDKQFISTDSVGLDGILGGGIQTGNVVEIAGEEGVGKTTLALLLAKNAIKQNIHVHFYRLEKGVTLDLVRGLGIDEKDITWYSASAYAEDILESITTTLAAEKNNLIIIDSYPYLIPNNEGYDKAYGQSSKGTLARVVGDFLRKNVTLIERSNSTIIFLNQVRDAGVSSRGMPLLQSPGGHAFKHGCDVALWMYGGKSQKSLLFSPGKQIIGHLVKFKLVKTRINAIRFIAIAGIPLISGKGFDQPTEIVNLLDGLSLLEKRGPATDFLNETFRGKDKLIERVAEDEGFRSKSINMIQEFLQEKIKSQEYNNEDFEK